MDSTRNEKPRALVDAEEEALVERQVMIWLNTWPDKPCDIGFVALEAGKPGIALFPDGDGAYFEKKYIAGGHRAVYPFSVVRRIIPGDSTDDRLKAVELLNGLGAWAASCKPDLPGKVRAVRAEPISRGKFAGPGDDGDEDYEIKIKLTYEVI